jgi:hypothetical protein
MTRDVQVTFDAADPRRLGAFWAEALGYVTMPPPAPHETWEAALAAWGVPRERWDDAWALVDPEGSGPRIYFQKVPEGKQGKNRVHLDVRAAPGLQGEERTAALAAEADRLVALGAVVLEHRAPEPPLGAGHVVLADPEGNEFCLD